MKKILFIEDRPLRQAQYFTEAELSALKAISGLLFPAGDDCRIIIDKINKEELEVDQLIALVVAHRSAFSAQGLLFLVQMTEKREIDLILFSGGSNQLNYTAGKRQFLSMNSNQIYKKELSALFNEYTDQEGFPLLKFQYGDNYELELFLKYRLLQTKLSLEEDEDLRDLIELKIEPFETAIRRFDPQPEKFNQTIEYKIAAL
ncbi:hypothetical protein [Neolewinella antarctica]|uniref:Uncharacterized protein n=1 Tax=Neolewinella antarctica TaxID=442734 RepID=A0ABX0XCL8_9BACT|nr:hypothetical protein [Neolewinella antarctica]NJC27026.1 hypothetical protein [Neolewinella antarctica]